MKLDGACLVVVATAVAFGCAAANTDQGQEAEPDRLLVSLRVEQTRTESPASYTLPVDTLAVVRGLGTDDTTTLASASARSALAELRNALARDARPAASAPLELQLPAAAKWSGVEWDIVAFGDEDADGVWSTGEPYVAAWSGGRGTYRLVYLTEPDAEHPDAGTGWSLLEGGQPRTYHPGLTAIVVPVNPIEEPVVGR